MASRKKRDLEDENRLLRRALEELYDRIGDALSLDDDIEGRRELDEPRPLEVIDACLRVAESRARTRELASARSVQRAAGRQTGLCPPDRPLRLGVDAQRSARLPTPEPDGRPPQR